MTDYIERVKNIMIYKNPYGKYHKQNFDTYRYGEMTPINSDIINDIQDAEIILSEEVYGKLQAIQDVTNIERKEVPFFLYGKEIDNNKVEFTDFYTSSRNRQSTEATFNEDMVLNLKNNLKNNLNNKFVVCHGHSHPSIGNFHENFSVGDFAAYLEMNETNPVFKNGQAQLTGCLVTSTGNINFVFYDNKVDNFYRFTKVFVKDKYNNKIPISCYGMKQPNNQLEEMFQDTNYSNEMTNNERHI